MKRAVTQRLETLFTQGRAQPLFLRISGYKPGLEKTLLDIHEMAQQCGVVLEERIPNPTTDNINYFTQMAGQDFRLDKDFITDALSKWMPRLSSVQRQLMSTAVTDVLQQMQRGGKTESMLRNAYMRIMCWLYFRFERVAVQLGKGRFPVILMQGTPSSLELSFLSILCQAGCDIVLLQYKGDADYQKVDARNEFSDPVTIEGARAFPPDFNLKAIYRAHLEEERKKRASAVPPRPAQPPVNPARPAQPQARPQPPVNPARPAQPQARPQPPANPARPAQPQARPQPPVNPSRPAQPQARPQPPVNPARPAQPQQRPAQPPVPVRTQRTPAEQPLRIPERDYIICPNIWMKEDVYQSMLTPGTRRGDEDRYIYTCFVRQEGVRDRQTYQEELLRLHQKLQEAGRHVLVIDEGFAPPSADEIQQIRRHDYLTINEAITDLAKNLKLGTALDLQNTLVIAFMEVLAEEAKSTKMNVQRLVNDAVHLLCWFKRIYPKVFSGWKYPALGCLIYLGVASSGREALFLRFLSRLPLDLLMLCPDLEQKAKLDDPLLLVQELPESVRMEHFPKEGAMRVSTVANDAQRDIRDVLSETGMYTSQQFAKAKAVLLESTVDEVFICWNEDLKYRQAFSATSSTAMLPVLFAQISGVYHGKVKEYWQTVKKLVTPDTVVLKSAPYYTPEPNATVCGPATDFLRGGKLQRRRIKEHPHYPFGFMREEMQEHILDKIQLMIDERIICGTGENGVEYQIVSTILGMNLDWARRIQRFDFSKKNPKVLCVHAGEKMPSREDAILLAFLHLVGFDIVGFVPTGYQWLGKWYSKQMFITHQYGDFIYDMAVPELNATSQNGHGFLNIFRRGS